MRTRATLARAYARTLYGVQVRSSEIVLRVARPVRQQLRELRCAGLLARWDLLTPVFPRSRHTGSAQHHRRLREFAHRLKLARVRCLPACNRAPRGDWPPEPALLLLDAQPGLVRRLARQYGQAAFLSGGVGRTVQLRWL